MKKKQKKKNIMYGTLWYSLYFSVVYWILASLRDSFLEDGNFFNYIIPHDTITVWTRMLAVFVIVLACSITTGVYNSKISRIISGESFRKKDGFKNVLKDTIPGIIHKDLKTKIIDITKKFDLFINEKSQSFSNGDLKHLSEIKSSVDSLLYSIESLWSFSQVTAGTLKLNKKVFNYYQLIRNVVYSVQAKAKNKNVLIEFNNSQENLLVYADKEKLLNSVKILLNSLIEITPSGQKITIDYLDIGSDILLTFNGKFTNFFRNDLHKYFVEGKTPLRELNDDNSLDFVIARAAVLSHKGRIWVEKNRNRSIALNISIEKEHIPEILVIDDDINTVVLIKKVLEGEKLNVVGKTNGEDSFLYLKKNNPDLIIIDLMMPGIDGYEFIETLEKEYTDKNIPIMIISGFPLDRNILMEVSNGKTFPYLNKPLDIFNLKKNVMQILSNSIEINWDKLFLN